MSKEKFTAGPWLIKPEEADKDYIRIRGDIIGGRFKVANVLNPAYEGAHIREAEETRANAHLIAAAPELYQELFGLLDALASTPELNLGSWGIDTDSAKSVLEKARGEYK